MVRPTVVHRAHWLRRARPRASLRGWFDPGLLRLTVTVGALAGLAGAGFMEGTQPGTEARAGAPAFACRVVRVHDGDTLTCAGGTRVRLHAVAAREMDGTCRPGHPCPAASAQAARDALRRLTLGRVLTCEPTGRSYERIAALCRTPGGVGLSCAMIETGLAERWDRFDRQRPACN